MTASIWTNFLQSRGFSTDDACLPYSAIEPTPPCLFDLSSIKALLCEGDDAPTFLQGQLSNDVNKLQNVGDCQLSAYCTPKGRMLALFVVVKTLEGYVMIAPQAVIGKVQKRLQMFVMRAKVKFELAQNLGLLGGDLGNDDCTSLLSFCQQNAILTCRYPSSARMLFIAPHQILISLIEEFDIPLTDEPSWQSKNIAEGLPQLNETLIEELIPQSLNLDLVDGVNFKKGCYPGQEIIARIKYRGKPKTRMITCSVNEQDALDLKLSIGIPIFIPERTSNIGVVVNIGKAHNGQVPVQITAPVTALSDGNLFLASSDGPLLTRADLPYPIPV